MINNGELMKTIAVFCGSSLGGDQMYHDTAVELGQLLAARGIGLVYGGGRSGLMGVVADAVLQAGGEVIGVMPKILVEKELAHPNLTHLYLVDDMQQRKLKMSELSDGFIALPGGAGTLEEIFEQWTWAQLGIHLKPCAFLNAAGFYDGLFAFLQHSVDQGFTHSRFMQHLIHASSAAEILEQLNAYQAPEPKWGMVEPV